jgi:predicted nucleotidyltransferase
MKQRLGVRARLCLLDIQDTTNLVGRGLLRGDILSKSQAVAILKQNQAYLSTKYGVKRMGLFGSYAKGCATEESDVDIVVEFERPIGFQVVELAEDLEKLLGRKVDLLTPAGIQGIRVARIAKDISESMVYV